MDRKKNFNDKLLDLKTKVRANGLADEIWDTAVLSHSNRLNRANKWLWLAVVSFVTAILAKVFYDTMDPRCIVGMNLFVLELARPAVSCDVCKDMTSVPTVDGKTFTRQEFLRDYAYNGVPLLVKGGAKNWTALDTFSFGYLKELFQSTQGALDAVQNDCQFFPYKTDFNSLADVFEMPEARSKFLPGEKQWYVGWSNCHPDVAKELRKHYSRPQFLPADSESSNLDWLFMGGFGGGADVHIDYVQRPSWQAMIAGKKSWKIVPSPECDTVCRTLNATMEKGDISEMSITIGSEYD